AVTESALLTLIRVAPEEYPLYVNDFWQRARERSSCFALKPIANKIIDALPPRILLKQLPRLEDDPSRDILRAWFRCPSPSRIVRESETGNDDADLTTYVFSDNQVSRYTIQYDESDRSRMHRRLSLYLTMPSSEEGAAIA